jgi:hypothetical protein
MFHHAARARVLLACVAAFGIARPAAAADSAPWATGANLNRELATPLGIAWDNTPLAYALSSLSQARHVAVLRDRRIDPQQPLELAIDDQPLSAALAKIAAHLQIGYCQFGPVAYFGPPETAQRLRTLAALRLDDVRRLPAPARRKLLLLKSWQWDRLAEPRQLANQLAREADVELVGAERIAHDLWPAGQLPPLSWIDRLTLLAAQFDLTFEIDGAGRRVKLVEVPGRVSLARTYLAGGDAADVAERWARALPGAKVDVAGGRIRLDALLEDHELVENRFRGTPTRRTTVAAGRAEYQFSVENAALDKVVAQLANQLDLDFRWDKAAIMKAGIAVDQLISVKVADAGLDELLAAVFAGTGLSIRRDGRSIVIRPE